MTVSTEKQGLSTTLLEFGLSEKEVAIYLALLEIGVAGANEIAKKSGINRSSAYVVIESLKKKGLISMTVDKKVQEYIAASPDTLLHIANEAHERSTKIQKNIENLLPELRALHTETTHKPKVLVYEGDEANKVSHYSTFGSSEFRIFKDLSGMTDSVPPDYIEKDAEKRKENGTTMYLISPNTKENTEIAERYIAAKPNDKIVLVPKEKFSKSGNNIGIGIYKDRIKFASAKDKFAIFIVNQAITDTLRDLFDLAMDQSQKVSPRDRKKSTRNKKRGL